MEVSKEELALELAENTDAMLSVQEKIIAATIEFQNQLTTLKQRDTELRAAIVNAMENSSTKDFENDYVKFLYIGEQERAGVDVKKLKLLRPDIYEEFEKKTKVRSQVRITIK